MSKILEIKVNEYLDVHVPESFKIFSIPRKPMIKFSEIDNIVKERGYAVSDEEFNKAIDTIIIAFAQRRLNNIIVDIDYKNRNVPKKMTIKEIEAALGHKVEIIKEAEKDE